MIHQIGRKLREQIHYFSGELSGGLGKVKRRFVEEMLFGIQARGSVRLTEVGRALEERISLHKTHDRLSRNLADPRLQEVIGEQVLAQGARRVSKDTLLIVDISDLSKKYAKKMEYLGEVRDGSEKKIGLGYWLCEVVGAEVSSSEITPLAQSVWSQEAEDFVSENEELLSLIQRVHTAVGKQGVFVIDRGGDRGELYKELVGKRKYRFIIRQRGDRHLLYKGVRGETLELAESCPTPYAETVVKEKDGKETTYFLEIGFLAVRLPEYPGVPLWLVVVKGIGEQPLMLLTTEQMRRNRKVLWWAVEAYLTRWKVEETIRFIKQSYQLEDIRVLTYQRLQNLVMLVFAAFFFSALYLGRRAKLRILGARALSAAKRVFGVPDFRYYALAYGIKEILSRVGKGPLYPRGTFQRDPPQMNLFEF